MSKDNSFKCVSRGDIFDKQIIQDDIIRLAIDCSKFGHRLGKIKFMVVGHDDVRVFQCAIRDLVLDTRDGSKKCISLISEVEE